MQNDFRSNFPILKQTVNNKPLVYLDNAATTQKPQQVIDSLVNYYTTTNSNIHRGAHFLANKATEEYEGSREKLRAFINAPKPETINFTRGTTESINLIAYAYGLNALQAGDEILISATEHHANIVPWQFVAEKTGAKIKVIPINEKGELRIDLLDSLLTDKTKIVAVAYVSNALGTIHPIQQIIEKAHKVGAKVVIDGAQSVAHLKTDVQAWDCDFFVFSAHKMYGPTGVGVLYAKEELLNEMKPFLYGGEMIAQVSYEHSTFNVLPFKFEAGTPNIADAIAFGAAVDFINSYDIAKLGHEEDELLTYATTAIQQIEGVKIIGTAENKTSVLSFVVDGIHNYDLGVLLDKQGIAIRIGTHCCQPLIDSLCIEGTCRASFAPYNTKEEVDVFIKALQRAVNMLKA